MHSTDPLSRSSIDLSLSSQNTLPKPKVNRNTHPPRLQHSPSLPNIWFPPHSGPIPPQFEGLSRDALQRPSTPPSILEIQLSIGQEQLSDPKPISDHLDTITASSIVDHHQNRGYSLLTPPSTPSSSQTANITADSSSNPYTKSDEKQKAALRPTRFLLLENISKQIQHGQLRASIVGLLTTPHFEFPDTTHDHSDPSSRSSILPLSEDSIKGVFLRRQQSEGIVILAFFDVRHAETALKVISTPTIDSFSQCVGDQLTLNGERSWITCRFIKAEELVEVIGNSPFLASTDASFYISVEDGLTADFDRNDKGPTSISSYATSSSDEPDNGVVTLANGNKLDLNMLRCFLSSFGDIHSLFLSKSTVGQKNPPGKVFKVEYFDVRDAVSAYAVVDGQVFLGTKLRVFGRRDSSDANTSKYQAKEKDIGTSSFDASQKLVQSASPGEFIAQIGPPGHNSYTRERFHVCEGSYMAPTHPVPQPLTSSPTYFYSSDIANHVPYETSSTNSWERSSSEDAVHYSATGQYTSSEGKANHTSPEIGHMTLDSRNLAYDLKSKHSSTSGSYECYYYPLAGASSPAAQAPYFYHLDQRLTPQNPPFTPLPSPRMYGYPFNNPYCMPPPTPFTNFQLKIPMGENCHSDSLVISHTAAPRHVPQHVIQLPYMKKQDIPSSSSLTSKRPSLHSAPSHSRTLGEDQRSLLEHNQLNIGRIEDGQDTRTTVMIKNIPNKMSDKDLIAYIGDVCPRRIDFLYLRMDFQNGCNVGYAFVNFIAVQDLLFFAKKRLGVKWNLFSSEKVLQMSYANYQGKEALVEKFKNSCIMDEKEAWRPKIFYSDPGPEQGLPEPFPAPTHIRRKERSAFNRGALYVPGVARGAPHSVPHFYRQQGSHGHTDKARSVPSAGVPRRGSARA